MYAASKAGDRYIMHCYWLRCTLMLLLCWPGQHIHTVSVSVCALCAGSRVCRGMMEKARGCGGNRCRAAFSCVRCTRSQRRTGLHHHSALHQRHHLIQQAVLQETLQETLGRPSEQTQYVQALV